MTRQLPKSLHTISVLVNLTRHLMTSTGMNGDEAITEAIFILKLNEMPDNYGLVAKALLRITKPENRT